MAIKNTTRLLIEVFKSERELYGECPCCGEIFRMSDAKIFYGKRPPKDWLERLKAKNEELNRLMREFEKNKKKIREDAVKRALTTRIGKVMEQMVPIFPQFGHDPSDLRALLTPIDFVAFNGMFPNKAVKDITFIEVKTQRSKLSQLQKSIEKAIDKGRVDFKVYTVPPKLG